jgi:hypothetical protein
VFSADSDDCGVKIEEGVETFILDEGLISGQTIHTTPPIPK